MVPYRRLLIAHPRAAQRQMAGVLSGAGSLRRTAMKIRPNTTTPGIRTEISSPRAVLAFAGLETIEKIGRG